MEAEIEATWASLTVGIDRRSGDAATFRAFVRLHVETRRLDPPPIDLSGQKTQPLLITRFDLSSDH
jgi:hypothetical protein